MKMFDIERTEMKTFGISITHNSEHYFCKSVVLSYLSPVDY